MARNITAIAKKLSVQRRAPAPTPLLPGEDPVDRQAVRDELLADVQPRSCVERMLVDDACDAICETNCWTRYRADILRANAHAGIEAVLATRLDVLEALQLAQAWRRGDPQARAEVDALLAELDPDGSLVAAHTIVCNLDLFTAIDHHLQAAKRRRAVAVHDLLKLRQWRAEALQRFTADEAYAMVLEPPPRLPAPAPEEAA